MEQTNRPVYSVVVPVFNSTDSLEHLFNRIQKVFEQFNQPWEIVLVDDHSTDDSWQKLEKLQAEHPAQVIAVALSRNFGQHNATICGIAQATGRYILTLDDDLQNPPEEIPKLIAAMQQTDADLVYGIPVRKHHSLARNIGSSALKAGSRRIYGTKGNGSSYRLIKSDLGKKLLNHQINFVYLDELFNWYTDRIEFVQVEHHPRSFKQSNYSSHGLFSLFSNLVIYYTAIPLRIMVYGGFISSLLSFFLGLWFIYRKIVHDVPLGFTALIVVILFSTSIILLSLGIIGEYLSRIYLVQNRKPPYSIHKILRDEVL